MNFPTILYTQADPFTESVQLLGRTVDFDIEATSFTWRTGDGETVTTDWPGKAYQPDVPLTEFVTHRYLDRGGVSLAVDTTWTAQYRVDGGPWLDVPEPVVIEGAPVGLDVRTATPKLVGTVAYPD